jgi:glycine/D-amino acid oxidase-like deaminating enzyme
MNELDYIIVGQGLAGSVLAFQLMEAGKKIVVIDENYPQTSSKVAAGLCNPVVFKRLTKSWLVESVLPIAVNFYRNQEQLLSNHFYQEMPIYKLFVDEKESSFWKQKSNEPELFDWISDKNEKPFDENFIAMPFGASKVLQSGFLRTKKWLQAFQEYLIKNNAFVESTFDYADLKMEASAVCWKNFKAKGIIFCEGYKNSFNPYFKHLPFKLTKGEVLSVDFENLTLEAAINKGVFVLPYDGFYKLGATYDWDNIDENITEKAKHELLSKAQKFIKDTVVVKTHEAGVRPTVSDRRPLLGGHPQHKNLFIFNGLGTKGVMLAPWLAQKFVRYLLHHEPLPEEVNINRFN